MALPLIASAGSLAVVLPQPPLRVGVKEQRALDAALGRYLEWRHSKTSLVCEARWSAVLRLRELLATPRYEGIALAGRDSALYEKMYRSNPDRAISRPRFMAVMRAVFGFELAPTRGALDPAKRLMDAVFDAFVHERARAGDDAARIDWRLILLMLHVVTDLGANPMEHLVWGLALFGSEGTFDATCSEPFTATLCDVKNLLSVLGSVNARDFLRSVVDDSWAQLCEVDPVAMKATSVAATRKLLAGKRCERSGEEESATDGLKVSRATFERLTAMEPFAAELAQARPFGRRDARTWTYRLEESRYPQSLMREVARARRSARAEESVRVFHVTHRCRERRMLGAWRFLAFYIRRIKRLVAARLRRAVAVRQRTCFERWVQGVLVDLRVRELQRVARGGLGRADARWALLVRGLVVTVQTGIRGYLVRVARARRVRRRRWAAVEIQRLGRARIATRLVGGRLWDHIDRERRVLQRRQATWRGRIQTRAAQTIQNCSRARTARVAVAAEKARAAACAVTTESMEALRQLNLRRRRIYEIQLQEWYALQKETHDRDTIYEDASNAALAKIHHHRRRAAFLKEQELKLRQAERATLLEEERVAAWIAKWEETKLARVTAMRQHMTECLETAETPHERDFAHALQKEIRTRGLLVLKRAAAVGIEMEIPEAREQALAEIALKRSLDVEREVDAERTAAADEYYAAKLATATATLQRADEERSRSHAAAARVIQRRLELFQARRELRRLCTERFEKVFDAESRSYYYRDSRTGDASWTKPRSMGAFDLRAVDRWVALLDETRCAYFYNPATLEMRWDRPPATLACELCLGAETTRAFCALRCSELEQVCCETCYQAAHAGKTDAQRAALTWKVLDGAVAGAASVDVEQLAETTQQHVLQAEKVQQRAADKSAELKQVQLQRKTRSAAQGKANALALKERETLLDKAQRETKLLLQQAEQRAAVREERRRAEEAAELLTFQGQGFDLLEYQPPG